VPNGAGLDDIDWKKWSSMPPACPAWRRPVSQEVLLKRGCLAGGEAGLRPTCAGLLLFGRDPQRWVHSSEIVVARYAGTAMDDRFIKEEIRGTLPQQIRRAEAFVVDNLRRGVRLAGLERIEEPEYPVKAVREAIVTPWPIATIRFTATRSVSCYSAAGSSSIALAVCPATSLSTTW